MSKLLSGGEFFGAVQERQECCAAIFTDLRHHVGRKLPAHSHELPFFALLLEGNYRERYGSQQVDLSPFSLSFRPAGFSHQDEIGPRGLRFFEIELRCGWQRRMQDCSARLDDPRDDCAGGHLLWLGMKLFRETREPKAESDLGVESLLAELLAAASSSPHETVKHVPVWLSRVVDKLESEHCERLTLDDLSKEAGVHPVHLSRVFRKCRREGIGEYVHRLRIRSACQQMLAPEVTLAEIALSAGFADQSHFTRAFQKITGTSPGAFRASLA
jgi:AraC family transcriptional regulator